MKIGLLSMQKVINYGSFLQAYALKKTIEELGHTVYFIDIRPGNQILDCQTKSRRNIKIDRFILKRVEHIIFKKRRESSFINNYFHDIGINTPVSEEECDAIVIGSDEVFNCCQPSLWGFSAQLFGDTVKPSITYAASCGYTDVEKLKEIGKEKEVIKALNKLKKISVRDENTYTFVQKLTGKLPEQHLDPVLIFDWNKIALNQTKYKDYILVYAYDNRIVDEYEIMAIKSFAKKARKKLISFGVYQRWCDINVECSPFELISYFDSADYVITDTFHGTVISIKRNKKFATLIRESNKNKLQSLLNFFGLESRAVENMQSLPETIKRDIDYETINQRIEQERKRTINYLRNEL